MDTPFITQSVANCSRLQVVSLALTSPTNTSLTTHLISVLDLPIAVPAKLLGFRAGVAFEGRMTGKVQLSVLGVPISEIDLRQVVELEGMRGLRDVTVRSVDLYGNHPLGGVAIRAQATLLDPTNTTISLGTLSYGLEYQGLRVALVEIEDLKLVPGPNPLELRGRLLVQVGEGLSIRYHQRSHGSMKPSPITSRKSPFTNPAPTDLVDSIGFTSLSAEFTPERAYSPLFGASITAKINSPFAFPFNITSLAENLTMRSTGAKAGAMAELIIPNTVARLEKSGRKITIATQFEGVPLKVMPVAASHRRFEMFLEGVVFNKSSEAIVTGGISVSTTTAVGPLRLTNIPLRVRVAFPGMSGLRDPSPSLKELTVTGVDGDRVQFKAQVTLSNPTQFSGGLGDVRLGIWYSGSPVGNVTLLGFKVLANATSRIDAIGSFVLPRCYAHGCDTRDDYLRQQFLSDYVAGSRVKVHGRGGEDSTNITSLKPALGRLNYPMDVPRVPEFLQGRGVVLQLANPLGEVTTRILSIHANASHRGTDLGTIDVDFTAPQDPIRNPRGQSPIVLPPKSVKTKPLPVKVRAIGWSIIRSALDGVLLVNVSARASASLHADNRHPVFLQFTRLNVATRIRI
ncbi:hypothetical protein L0F63_005363 [Massospora cicadina]|nr:hypothetical protein L0F63_005363 [Massospora cicadina]